MTSDSAGTVEAVPGDQELRRLLAGLTAVRDGDFGTRLPDEADGLMGDIAKVFNGMVDQLSVFTSEVTRVSREVGTEGTLGGQARVPGVSGTWADLTDSVNAMAGNLTTQVRDIAQVATAVARGDLSQKIDVDARGEILELKNTINTMVDQLSRLRRRGHPRRPRGRHRRAARRPGRRAGRQGHLARPHRLGELHGREPDQPGPQRGAGGDRGGQGRPLPEDHRGRARRDPGTQEHHQHDGRPALPPSPTRSPASPARSAPRATWAGGHRCAACRAPGRT